MSNAKTCTCGGTMTHSSDMDDPNEQGRPFWQCEQCGRIVDDAPMSNAKHTPGDWKFQPSRLPGRKGCVVADEDRICVVDHAEDGPLIAAAPGLLEACKGHGFNLFALLNRLVNDGRLDETERDLVVDHIVFAREQIAKAEVRE